MLALFLNAQETFYHGKKGNFISVKMGRKTILRHLINVLKHCHTGCFEMITYKHRNKMKISLADHLADRSTDRPAWQLKESHPWDKNHRFKKSEANVQRPNGRILLIFWKFKGNFTKMNKHGRSRLRDLQILLSTYHLGKKFHEPVGNIKFMDKKILKFQCWYTPQ